VVVATERERARRRERLERVSESSLDCESIRREAIAELQRVIGFDRWCWPLADPETLLPGSGLAEHDFGPAVPRSLELEYSTDDFAARAAANCSRRSARRPTEVSEPPQDRAAVVSSLHQRVTSGVRPAARPSAATRCRWLRLESSV
jgi:hypothetical protein